MNRESFGHGAQDNRNGGLFARSRTARGQRIPCSHYPRCIGCPLIDVPYAEQLRRKQAVLARSLVRYDSLAEIFLPPIMPSPRTLGYRSRVKLVVRASRGKIATGLYVPGSHRVMDISRCPVHPQPVNDVLRFIKAKLPELDIEPYDERRDRGNLRHLDLRFSFAHRELNATLVTRRAAFPKGVQLARALRRRFPFVSGVVQNVNERRGNVIWGDDYRMLSGLGTIKEQVGKLEMIFPAGTFSQANPFTAGKLYDEVSAMAALKGAETVLDLYCGVAPITLSLAGRAGRIYGIDANALSIYTAKQNAHRNGAVNCEFIAGDAAQSIARLKDSVARFDLVIANPPRKGIQPDALKAMIALSAARIIYVSCAPESLARDLDRLVQHGYHVVTIHPFDMLPQTEDVEAVALLQQGQ